MSAAGVVDGFPAQVMFRQHSAQIQPKQRAAKYAHKYNQGDERCALEYNVA